MADNSAKIAELEAILETGATTVKVDGQEIVRDLNVVRAELRRLQAADDTDKNRRPVTSRINLSGF